MSFARTFVPTIALTLGSALLAQPAIAGDCPIEGLGAGLARRDCAQIDEIHDPDGHLNVSVGDRPRDGICIQPSEARYMETMICGGVRSHSLEVRDGAVVIPFSVLRMSGMGQLRRGINVTSDGEVLMHVDRSTNRFIMKADGKYSRQSDSSESHAFRGTLSIQLGDRTAAAARGAGDEACFAESTQSSHTEPLSSGERSSVEAEGECAI